MKLMRSMHCNYLKQKVRSVKLQEIQLFKDYLVVYERQNGLLNAVVFPLPPVGFELTVLPDGNIIHFSEPAYMIERMESNFSSPILRYRYSYLRTPFSVYDYDMNTQESKLKKIDLVCIEPELISKRLSLIDRGFVFSIAHIRGGGETGCKWYEDGKFLKKKNTFTDFITCAEHLLEQKFVSREKLCINGRSARGLLMGAVLNMRPDLFKVVVAGVPFVDVLNTKQ